MRLVNIFEIYTIQVDNHYFKLFRREECLKLLTALKNKQTIFEHEDVIVNVSFSDEIFIEYKTGTVWKICLRITRDSFVKVLEETLQ